MAANAIPKLGRTVTDAYRDELFNPNFHLTSSKEPRPPQASRANEIFAQAVHAANNHHFGMHPIQGFGASRGRSPFREGAPLAPTSPVNLTARVISGATPVHPAATSPRPPSDTSRSVAGTYGLSSAGGHPSEPNTPHTISPKDTFLEFQPTDGDDDFTLFASGGAPYAPQNMSKPHPAAPNTALVSTDQAHQPSPNDFGYYARGVPFEVQSRLPQQYPFIRQPRMQPLAVTSAGSVGGRVQSMGSRQNLASGVVGTTQSTKPAGASADGGTYTCTYHGCTLRFETPALLQKHKREGHRQAHGLNSAGRRLDPNSSLLNTQSGPHKCDRINPTTGKPCNAMFSRPYDLTRHEDTIHNIRKVKVRCELCTEEKTFSRADALTRHFRVCHPGVEIPAKHRRRGPH